MTASSSAALLPERLQTILRNDVQGMHAYAVQPSAGFIKLDAMENPFPLPPELQAELGRRLGQGASPVRSTLYRGISSIGADLVGYWPMEDGVGSSTIKAVVGRIGRIIGSPALAAYDDMPASAAIPNARRSARGWPA